MQNELEEEILRGAVLVLTSFFLAALITGSIGKYFFLVWLVPLIVIVTYPLYVKLASIRKKNEDRMLSENIKIKRKISNWTIALVISVIFAWNLLVVYVNKVEFYHAGIGIIISIIMGRYIISRYIKR